MVVLAGGYVRFLFDIFSGRAANVRGLSAAKSADFLAYDTAAKMVVSGMGHTLYNLGAQAGVQSQLTGPGYMLSAFVNPPFLALLLAPLGHLPYTTAFLIWDLVLLSAIVAGIYFAVSAADFSGLNAWLVGGTALAMVSIFMTLRQGQASGLVLLGLALSYWCWKKNKMGLVGAALALTLFKPHLVLLMPGLLLARREWRALASFAIVSALLVVVSAIAFGPNVWVDYLKLIGPQTAGGAAWATGARTQFGLLGILGGIGLSQTWGLLVCGLLGVGLLIKIARRKGQLAVDFALCVVASFVLAPHANFHDASVMVVAGVLLAGVLAHNKRTSLLDKLVLALAAVAGMTIILVPPIVSAYIFLLWAVHIDYLGGVLSSPRASTSSRV